MALQGSREDHFRPLRVRGLGSESSLGLDLVEDTVDVYFCSARFHSTLEATEVQGLEFSFQEELGCRCSALRIRRQDDTEGLRNLCHREEH